MVFLRDRFRTTCNITGDAFGAAVIEKFSRNDLGPEMELEGEGEALGSPGMLASKDDAAICTNFCVRETKM